MATKQKNQLWLAASALVFAALLFTPRLAHSEANLASDIRSITVLPPTDGTGLNLGRDLQQYMGEYLYGTRQYVVQYSAYELPGFTAKDLFQTFERLDSQLIVYAYVEPTRFSLFLFDSARPQEYVASSVPLGSGTQTPQLSKDLILQTFPAAYDTLVNNYIDGIFNPLPGADLQEQQEVVDENTAGRNLFRKLTALQYSDTYAGANVGIVRLSGEGESGSSASLSIYGGYRLSEGTSLEGGIDLHSYIVPNARLRFGIGLFEGEFARVSVSVGAGMVMGVLAKHRGFNSTNIATGATVFGGGFGVEIPLGGSSLFCDLRMYMGGGSLLIASYGIAFNI